MYHVKKRSVIEIVYNGRPKNEKDTYLMGLIQRYDVARHRPATAESRQNPSSFKYFAMEGTCRVEVCRSAYMSLHGLSNKVVQRLTKLRETETSPFDMRGRHANRGNKLDGAIVAKIDDHIKSFPKKESHYSSKLITYLDASLNITKMYELFTNENPDLKTHVKYEYYLRHFQENYGYRFGRSQVDVCSTCEDLNAKIKSTTLNETAKRCAVADLMIHKRQASKFYKKFQEIKEICKERNDVGAIVFDYMQNLPLPLMPVQEMFYLRKLIIIMFLTFTALATMYRSSILIQREMLSEALMKSVRSFWTLSSNIFLKKSEPFMFLVMRALGKTATIL
ncbi:uncharacterized protein LOC132705208 [Cylas formicarius]|uniref:uncharacterized protein LOC132705208 n=1 Tax=Cylas formicarius TaxID=197179 RepID=UPI00295897F8|nr:uncharacterized protein LOC132705208 [Cylas formicarius]